MASSAKRISYQPGLYHFLEPFIEYVVQLNIVQLIESVTPES